MKIIFVCHGNICRSTMAEFVMKHIVSEHNRTADFIIDSAATSLEEIGNDTHPGTKRKLREEGIPFTRHAARRITRNDCINNDLIIAMDYENLHGLARLFGNEFDSKIHLLLEYAPNYSGGHIPYGGGSVKEIADPWYSGNFDETFRDVWAGCMGLFERFARNESLSKFKEQKIKIRAAVETLIQQADNAVHDDSTKLSFDELFGNEAKKRQTI